jgi:hypothetical protein
MTTAAPESLPKFHQSKGIELTLRLLSAAFFSLFLAVGAWPQGFSGTLGNKKTIILHRKLPAAVKLTGMSTFSVVGNAKSKDQADVAQNLSDILVTEIQKDDRRLQEEKNNADLVISCTITHYEVPPPQTSTRSESVLQNGHMVQVPKQYYRLIGELEVAYQAKDRKTGKMVDSQNLSAKYNREFESGTNEATDKSITSKMTDPFKKLAGKKVEDTGAPPTPLELRELLIHQVVSQIASRLVSTDEPVPVLLAHGKQLDSANKLADSGMWQRYLEALETTTPFPDPREDAYRLYNIGVANEALAYQTEDRKAASTLLQDAAINYGKAIDQRPDEKYFLEPQTRIETAITYYKKLGETATTTAAADPPAASSTSAGKSTASTPSSNGTAAKSSTSHSSTKSSTTSTTTASSSSASSSGGGSTATKTAKTASSTAPAAPALTNQKIIDMVKGGVDEENIIATIREAPNVQFDLSPDGQINLAQNGVKGKLLAAMRERSRQPSHAKTASP